MATFETHCNDCIQLFHKDYSHVHKWLDQMSQYYYPIQFFDYHRTYFHNKFGLLYILNKWGIQSYNAGRIHLLRDMDWLMVRSPKMDDYSYTLTELYKLSNKAIMYFNFIDTMGPEKHNVKARLELVHRKDQIESLGITIP